MKNIWIILIVWLPLISVSQDFEYEDYQWESTPTWEVLDSAEATEHFIILKNKRVLEYTFDENRDLVVFDTRHKMIRVNDDLAIESFNKVYIPLRGVIELIELKARTVKPNGETIEVNKDNIKEIENLEDRGNYKIFAIEGLEKGNNVEYFYTLKKSANFYGRIVYQQEGIVRNASIEIISPEHLVFKTKSYNGFPDLESDVIDGKNYLTASIDHIEGQVKERYAAFDANLMRIEYKFSHNVNGRGKEILTWDDAAKEFYEANYTSNKKLDKKIKKELATLNINSLSGEDKIRTIENHIKNNYLISEGAGRAQEEIGEILKNKFTTEDGMVKLFAHMFRVADIHHELVFTSNRYLTRFDPEFESWNFLEDNVFYFPDFEKYLAPISVLYRYGMIPFQWSSNYGLFIMPIDIEGFNSGIHRTAFIKSDHFELSYENRDIEVVIPDDFSEVVVQFSMDMAGHTAMGVQPYFGYISSEEQEELIESLLKSVGNDAEVSNSTVENIDNNISPMDNPMIVTGDIILHSILEKAGDSYLFKIGDLLGEQVEMYQEKERQNPVETEFPHSYKRNILLHVPGGYEVKDLEKLSIDIQYGDEEELTMGFVSSYKLDGDNLAVTVYEYYKKINYPLEQFEEFREVINAAADFNKIVLVFEKK